MMTQFDRGRCIVSNLSCVSRNVTKLTGAKKMEPTEIQARASIAAALITSRAVEIPTIPTSGDWSQDSAALRLRDLTDYVYQMITTPRTR